MYDRPIAFAVAARLRAIISQNTPHGSESGQVVTALVSYPNIENA